ncbi:hypothetical protein VC83_03092 [Pseudogymnoascus destructans]|uniref:Uncharacterized protein n=2 Tax=Pseudogymnoascus destructans TaxID=655981 RepID=L8FTI9_PSED2|nr:uncharacterized protein VC83_03092 [Pseudogymnoascus destructans]ELR04187.1 hypothetical protein GMDG_06609 [Pseudogymnoascus destructans 20631-21]OAF60222.1 hypothetical protein VC83_03092 [Pseudogymnoascus destructans]
MDRFLGKLKKKAGGGRNKADTDKAHRPLEASSSPSPSLSPEPKSTFSEEFSSFWNSKEAFETTLHRPVTPSGDRHSNYRPHRRAPETPPATATSLFPPGFSSHPYEHTKKSYPPPRTSEVAIYSPGRIKRKELPDNEKTQQAPETSKVTVRAVPQADKESEQESEQELERGLEPSTRNTSQEIEGSVTSLESPSLDSKHEIVIKTKAERTAELLAKKYARLVHQQEELHARKYMHIIHHREELESRGILWPTNAPTHEYPDDKNEPQVYEFPQFVPKPLMLRNQKEPSEGSRSNQRQISANGVVHDYEAAKLESWRQFYGKGEMMKTLHNEIDEYLGALLFKRLLKETAADATRESTMYRSEITVRKYWEGVRGFLGSEFKNEDTRN